MFCKCGSTGFLYKSVAQSFHNTWLYGKCNNFFCENFSESFAQITHNARISCAQESCTKLKGTMVNTGEYGSTSDRACHFDVAGATTLWRCAVIAISPFEAWLARKLNSVHGNWFPSDRINERSACPCVPYISLNIIKTQNIAWSFQILKKISGNLELINYMFGRKWRIMDANAEVYWVYWQTWHRWPGKGQELPVKLSKITQI